MFLLFEKYYHTHHQSATITFPSLLTTSNDLFNSLLTLLGKFIFVVKGLFPLNFVSLLYFYRYCIRVRSSITCSFWSIVHSIDLPPVSSMLLRTENFLLLGCIALCVYTTTSLSTYCCWWFGSFPYIEYCDLCYNEQRCACIWEVIFLLFR